MVPPDHASKSWGPDHACQMGILQKSSRELKSQLEQCKANSDRKPTDACKGATASELQFKLFSRCFPSTLNLIKFSRRSWKKSAPFPCNKAFGFICAQVFLIAPCSSSVIPNPTLGTSKGLIFCKHDMCLQVCSAVGCESFFPCSGCGLFIHWHQTDLLRCTFYYIL